MSTSTTSADQHRHSEGAIPPQGIVISHRFRLDLLGLSKLTHSSRMSMRETGHMTSLSLSKYDYVTQLSDIWYLPSHPLPDPCLVILLPRRLHAGITRIPHWLIKQYQSCRFRFQEFPVLQPLHYYPTTTLISAPSDKCHQGRLQRPGCNHEKQSSTSIL